MREIKFRGKRKDNNVWVYGYLIDGKFIFDKNSEDYDAPYYDDTFGIIDGHLIEVIPETIGQYTGIKDKNGIDIYEGDIVKVDIDKAIVEYSDNYSGFILKPIGEYYFDSFMLAHTIDIIDNVIGNIYENKELLDE